LIGKRDPQVFPEDIAQIYFEEELPIFRDGTPLRNKIDPYYDESGSVGWVNTNKWPLFDHDGKNVVGIFGISRDITELKKAEEAHMGAQLKGERLLRRIESLMKHANDCIMMLDSNTCILEVSDGCVDTYGYTREELLGMRAIDLSAAQAREEASDFTQRLAQHSSLSYQTWHCRKDGSSFPIEVGAAMIDEGDERFIQVIIRDISERVRERSKMELELAAYAKRLELASQRVLAVQEEAKRRFSGELHDRTSPNLAAIRLNLAIIARLSRTQSKERAERLEDTRALIDDTEASVREICTELRPPVLDYAGLAAALEGYARQFANRTGITVEVDCANGGKRLAPALESLLFRIYQEALTNCVKHARARSIAVALSSGAHPITLTIADDGDGFDLQMLEMDGQASGLGLLNMREMIEFSGGRFAIESRPGQGTRIEVTI
jgi:PAS domain S-box-containing protein